MSKRQSNWNGKITAKTPVKYIMDYFNFSLILSQSIKDIIITDDIAYLKIIGNCKRDGLNPGGVIELRMNILNTLTQGYGVEAIVINGKWIDKYWMDNCGLYVNQGDTYSRTIVFDTANGNYICTSWGDFFEEKENEKEIEDFQILHS
jgi:hypothetical protein